MNKPVHIAIVGSGPAGFFSAGDILKTFPDARVDVYERLPAPFGLVRYGVAPDHTRTRNVIRWFDRTASDPRFRFLGNVRVGRDVPLDELRRHYDGVLIATGAESEKSLRMAGGELAGFHDAIDVVGWYNGHPDFAHIPIDLSCETAVIIGHGNVALDIARMLSRSPDDLRRTDIAAHALDVISASRLKTIHLIGRRGPVQCSFTEAELSELLPWITVHADDLDLNPESAEELADQHTVLKQRVFDLLTRAAQGAPQHAPGIHLRFLRSPVALEGGDRVERIVLEKNVLRGGPGQQRAAPTGERETIACGLVISSIGYHGDPLPGAPFDAARGIIPNDRGRVLRDGDIWPGVYVAGWIKRGARGLIGHNKRDAAELVETLREDLAGGVIQRDADPDELIESLTARGVRIVTYADWQRIDQVEVERGRITGRPRERITSAAEMLNNI